MNPSEPPRKKRKVDKKCLLVAANPLEALQNILPTLILKSAHHSNHFVAWASFAGQHYEAAHPSKLLSAKAGIATRILHNFIAHHAFVEETQAGTSLPNYSGRIVEGVHKRTYIVGQKNCTDESGVESKIYILYRPKSKDERDKEPTAVREFLSSFSQKDMEKLTKSSATLFHHNQVDAVSIKKTPMHRQTKINKACHILSLLKPGRSFVRINQTAKESGHTPGKHFTAQVTVDDVNYVGCATSWKKAEQKAARKALLKINGAALAELKRDRQQPWDVIRTSAEEDIAHGHETNAEELVIDQQALSDSEEALHDVTDDLMDVETNWSAALDDELAGKKTLGPLLRKESPSSILARLHPGSSCVAVRYNQANKNYKIARAFKATVIVGKLVRVAFGQSKEVAERKAVRKALNSLDRRKVAAGIAEPPKKKQAIESNNLSSGSLLPHNVKKTLLNLISAIDFKSRGPTYHNQNFLAWTSFAGKHYEATDPSDLLKAKTRVAERILHGFAEIKAANGSNGNSDHVIASCSEREAIRDVLSSLTPEDIRFLSKNPFVSDASSSKSENGHQEDQDTHVHKKLYDRRGFKTFLRMNALSILAQLKPGSENYVVEKITTENGKKRFAGRVTVDGVHYDAIAHYRSCAGRLAARKAISILINSAKKELERDRKLGSGEDVPNHPMDAVVDSHPNEAPFDDDICSTASEVEEDVVASHFKVEKADPVPSLEQQSCIDNTNADDSGQNSIDSDVSFGNYVSRMIESAFQSLKEADPAIIPDYKSFAGVVMSVGDAINGSQVVSLATGSESISASNISFEGKAVNDCHAAILARRGLVSFLHDQLEKYGTQQKESIFEPAGNDEGPLPRLKVKEGIRFHLYLSSAPCGDASGQKDPSSAGALQIKTHGFDGTVPVSGFKIQTFEEYYKGTPLLTMSCSDKIARWTVVGAQGSLLSHIINPVYFHSVVIDGDHFNPRFTRRALIKRVKKVEGVPPPFTVTQPVIIGTSTSGKKTVLTSTPNHSICFVKGWDMHEKIDALNGVTIDSDGESGLSELCKSRFFQRFVGLVSSNPAWAPLFEPHMDSRRITYRKMKEAAEKFGKTDELLLASLSAAGLGQWMKKPAVQDLFPIFL